MVFLNNNMLLFRSMLLLSALYACSFSGGTPDAGISCNSAPLGNTFEQDPSQYMYIYIYIYMYTLRNMIRPSNMYAPSQEVFLMQGYHARVLLSGVCSFSVSKQMTNK